MNADLQLASRWKRLGAALIDGILGIFIMVPILVFTGVLGATLDGETMSLLETIGYAVLGWVVFFSLHGYLLYTRGQTIGKFLIGTQIVNADGEIPDFINLFIMRYLVIGLIASIPCIGGLVVLIDILFIFSEEKRCLHDRIAGTWVIDYGS